MLEHGGRKLGIYFGIELEFVSLYRKLGRSLKHLKFVSNILVAIEVSI